MLDNDTILKADKGDHFTTVRKIIDINLFSKKKNVPVMTGGLNYFSSATFDKARI